ncbi:MAG: hypothetical protein IJU20_02180 [Clostridia bacterium]|nr:hypothetical protein [Clostridia bacterium]
MKRGFKVIGLLLCALLLWGCAGTVDSGTESPNTDTETQSAESETEAGIAWLDENGECAFAVVRPDICGNSLVRKCVELTGAIKDTLKLSRYIPTTDFVERGEQTPDGKGEILVGDTNRALTRKYLDQLGPNEYIVAYDSGAYILVGENDRATMKAIEVFMEYFAKTVSKTGYLPEKLELKGEYSFVNVLKTENGVLRCARYRATELLQTGGASGAEAVLLGTLQGLVCNLSSQQILITAGTVNAFLPYIKDWGVEVSTANEDGKSWNTERLLNHYASLLDGYILCDSSFSTESMNVAVSLSGVLNAVAVPDNCEKMAKDAGLTMILDVRGKDDRWLRSSEYFSRLSRTVAVEQPISLAPKLVDVAAMTGAYFSFYDGQDSKEHDEKFDFLDDGAVVYGYNNTLGEFSTVASFSGMNLQMIPSDHAYNVSTLSSFEWDDTQQKSVYEGEGKVSGKHTVTFLLSDGDNVQWLLNGMMTDSRWYGSSLRGDFPMNYGVPTAAAYLTAPALKYLYDSATPSDYFVAELSGIGYTFPSKWSQEARDEMAACAAQAMEKADCKYLEILDDHGFEKQYLDSFLFEDAIEGLFYIDYGNYAEYGGKIVWVGDKPAVSARYRLWAGLKDGAIETIARQINAASTNPGSADAYSFVIVHAWSGVDAQGNQVDGGDSMAGVKALINLLDDDVEVVTADEFMARIRANVRH